MYPRTTTYLLRILTRKPAISALRLTGLFLSLVIAVAAHAQIKFAGTQFSIAGNNLSAPSSVAVDGKGNIYIADTGNNRIVSVTPSPNGTGTVATVLNGLSSPSGIASDWSGNLFIADTGNNRILMLPLTKGTLGTPVQIASGLSAPTGLALDSASNLYIADTGNNRIVELPRLGATYASPLVMVTGLSQPKGVAIDSIRNLYIADTGNNRILKETYSVGGYLTQQVVGKGFSGPMGVTVDSAYNVYIADTGNNRIVLEPWLTGPKRYNAQSILGSDAASPAAVVKDWDGNIYAADLGNNQVIEVITGSVVFGSTAVGAPASVQTYNFNIAAGTAIGFIGIFTNGATGKDFQDGGSSTCVVQVYDQATACGISVAFTPTGSGARTGAITIYDTLGNAMQTTFLSGVGVLSRTAFIPGTRTVISAQLSAPSGVAVDGYGNVYVADTGNNRVLQFQKSGSSYNPPTLVSVSRLDSPMGLNIDGAGNLYVVSNGNDTVLRLPWQGSGFGLQSKISANFYGPTGVTTDASGEVLVADTLDQMIFTFSWSGNGFSSTHHVGGTVKCPLGVAVDPSGNVYFTMPYMNSVQEIPLVDNAYSGQLTVSNAKVNLPSAIAADGNGNLFVLDTGNNRVVMTPWNGTAYGSQIVVADGFNSPNGLAVDLDGNLYVADTGNNQVVKIDLSTPQPLVFADTVLGSVSSDSAKSVTLLNNGNLPVSLASVAYSANFPQDARSSNPCLEGNALAPGSSCQFAVDFVPTATGSPLTEALSVQLDGAANPQSINVSGTSMGKAAQTITFPDLADVPYGTASVSLYASSTSALPVVYQVISGPATVNRGGTSLSFSGTGMVIVQATQAGSSSYAPASSVARTFQVLPATLTVSPVNTIATYGSVPVSFSYTVTGFIGRDTLQNSVTGSAKIASSGGAAPAAGTYTLTAGSGTLKAANYIFNFVTATLTVNKTALTVKAANLSATYAAPLGQYTCTYSGFVNGETASVLHGTPMVTSAANAHSPVGSYTLTPSLGTLSAANYAFVFISGVLNVLPGQLTVTATNQSIIYGQALPQMTFSITGFAAGDNIANSTTGAPLLSTKATALSGAGTYAITLSPGTLAAPNYRFAYVSGIVAIAKAILTVTPTDAAMTYGSRLPSLHYAMSGFVNQDTAVNSVIGIAALHTTAASVTRPGVIPITATLGTLFAKNYTFKFATGNLTIQKAILTVRASKVAMTYGAGLPAFAYAFDGFMNGDNSTAVTGKPSFTTSATSTSAVGSYAILGTVGTLASDRYTFTIIGSTLTVAKAVLKVVPDQITMTYGSVLPALTYKLNGLLNGDSATVVSGNPNLSTAASARSHVGAYNVQAAIGTLSATNYTFITVSGTITVTRATVTVTPANATTTYGGTIPAFAFSFKGLVNGDKPASIPGAPAFFCSVNSNSAVGSYAIHATAGSLSSSDYSFTFADGTLTVNQAILTITPNAATMTYGGAVPRLSYTISGFQNNDDARVISGKVAVTTTATPGSAAGSYPLAVDTQPLSAKNYTFATAPATLTVSKAQLTVTADNLSIKTGDAIPALTYKLTGMVNGDSATTAATGVPTLSTTATKTSAAGSYPITVTAGKMLSANYTLNFVNGTLTVN